MRFTRLKRQIESGSLHAAHGSGASSSSPPQPTSPNLQSESTPHPAPKRKRVVKSIDTTPTTTPTQPTKHEPGLPNDHKAKEQEQSQPNSSAQHTPKLLVPTTSQTPTPEFKTETSTAKPKAKEEKDSKSQIKIKLEDYSSSGTDFSSEDDDGDDEDSEDEMPLAKLRKRRGLGMGVDMDADVVGASRGIDGRAGYGCENGPVAVYNTFATRREGYSGRAPVTGDESVAESQRSASQGFDAMDVGFGNGSGSGWFDVGGFGSGAVRGLYASPYAGWIDGRSHEDQMGAPGPGWEHYARYQGQEHHQEREEQQQQQQQRQHQEFEHNRISGSDEPRKLV
ncbi:hypothetical protein IFR05_009613 [Cadophora sp. M221]|nr:hypothetical protein IFR05_009613 [Cadophora sp. M221]